MKIKIRPEDASVLQKHGWPQMGDWLAELRDDGHAELPADGRAEADRADDPWSEAVARADAIAEARDCAEAGARARADARAQAHADISAEATERAVIGDQLRMPVMWCEMGSCISWYTHPGALGEADTRARAIGAGWRIDALGRLACPRCQQTDPWFWATRPVVRWDRYLAVARAARLAAVPGDDSADSAWGVIGDPGRPASAADLPQPGWRRQYPAA